MTFSQIEQAFAEGKTLVYFKAIEARYVQELLRTKARKAGKTWKFATLPGEVFVRVKPMKKRMERVRK